MCSHVFVCAWICVCDPQVIGWFACVDHDIMIREYSDLSFEPYNSMYSSPSEDVL